ncbi:transglutaminase domain-containing protein [Rhizobium leguminosarum]|uniref:transglutaminase domain-containing protein n=1 Tax=Rhizobium leguminosarum TaxID=384 RepID=UPI001C916602|nr:transglutaminase domain-containing protein [Rhizobium leguminosarum]MBY2906069.1 hypothetical protein [Rhizobium leguminosarum]
MTAKLAEVASYCQSLAVSTSNSLAGATREFLARYSRHPTNPATGYYAQYTAPKNWDVIMTDFWKCIPAVSDPTQRYPELLCYDYSDLMVMILAQLGVQCRTVRAIAVSPLSSIGNYPMYLDHTFAEAWMGSKWSAQDGFYNVEYLIGGDYASADDLCGAADLDTIVPRNKPIGTTVWQAGWQLNGIDVALRQQDFYAAIEHRDDAGNSVVIMNGNRGDFDRLFKVSSASTPTPLRSLIVSSVKRPIPTVAEIRPLAIAA